jgi:hypothetical protein
MSQNHLRDTAQKALAVLTLSGADPELIDDLTDAIAATSREPVGYLFDWVDTNGGQQRVIKDWFDQSLECANKHLLAHNVRPLYK